jgi:hypothetical protein
MNFPGSYLFIGIFLLYLQLSCSYSSITLRKSLYPEMYRINHGNNNGNGGRKNPPRSKLYQTQLPAAEMQLQTQIPKYAQAFQAQFLRGMNSLQSSASAWWAKHIQGKENLVLVVSLLFNWLKYGLSIFRSFIHILLQYCNPLSIVLLKFLNSNFGTKVVKKLLFFSVYSGILKMVYEYYMGYLTAPPLTPLEDSYALITG